jgi:nucleoside-diphosphate-sugar epimerase
MAMAGSSHSANDTVTEMSERSASRLAGQIVLVTGAAGRLGRRVTALVAADPAVDRVVAIDVRQAPALPNSVTWVREDLRTVDLTELVKAVDCVIHLAEVSTLANRRAAEANEVNVEVSQRLLDACRDAQVPTFVTAISAMVYGAWSNNPIPLTEEAPLRPNNLLFAQQQAQLEHMVLEWAAEHPDRRGGVLRAATSLAPSDLGEQARILAEAARLRAAENDPPWQYLHLDDLASAVDLVRRKRLDGAFNCAPEGWLQGEQVEALGGNPPRLRLPAPLAKELRRLSWRLQVGTVPPGLEPYMRYPWVIASDRLRAEGWRARSSNEEAYVLGTTGTWWSMLSPKRKQELSLGLLVVASLAVSVTGGLITRRVLRSARRRRDERTAG